MTAGKDTTLRVYDEATKSIIVSMRGGMGYSTATTPGHSNRVFSCKFYPEDDNIIVSGGWDNTVQIWDIRAGHAVRSIYGPHICGDALDVVGNEIVTGSWRATNQLEVWDFSTGAKISSIPWSNTFAAAGSPACMLYAAQFSKENGGRGVSKYIIAGGSGINEAKIFDHANDNKVINTTPITHSLTYSPAHLLTHSLHRLLVQLLGYHEVCSPRTSHLTMRRLPLQVATQPLESCRSHRHPAG